MSQAQSKKSNIEQLETRTKRADNFFCFGAKRDQKLFVCFKFKMSPGKTF